MNRTCIFLVDILWFDCFLVHRLMCVHVDGYRCTDVAEHPADNKLIFIAREGDASASFLLQHQPPTRKLCNVLYSGVLQHRMNWLQLAPSCGSSGKWHFAEALVCRLFWHDLERCSLASLDLVNGVIARRACLMYIAMYLMDATLSWPRTIALKCWTSADSGHGLVDVGWENNELIHTSTESHNTHDWQALQHVTTEIVNSFTISLTYLLTYLLADLTDFSQFP